MNILPLFEFDAFNLLSSLLIVFGVQVFFFAFAAAFQTDKLTDFTYGMTFVLMAVLFLLQGATIGQILLCGAVIVWGLRLAGYLFLRILKIKHDERFDGRRENFLRFAAFWFFQGAVIWVALLPVTIAMSAGNWTPTVLSYSGLALFLIGLILETIADSQKFAFRNNPANRGKWIESGLWKYSRYPNYFGEIVLWWGIFLMATPALSGLAWLSVAGPVCITWILIKVSGIPLLEESHQRKYGGNPQWTAYVRRTSLLIPMPQRAEGRV
jgi:steroid 5-alpha reductase family enzyme